MASCLKCNISLPDNTKRVVCAECERQVKAQYATTTEQPPQNNKLVPMEATQFTTSLDPALVEAVIAARKRSLFVTVGTVVGILIAIGVLIAFIVLQTQANRREAAALATQRQQEAQAQALLHQPPPILTLPAPTFLAPAAPPVPRRNNVDWSKVDGNNTSSGQSTSPQVDSSTQSADSGGQSGTATAGQSSISQQVSALNKQGLDAYLDAGDKSLEFGLPENLEKCQADIDTLNSCIGKLKELDPDLTHGSMAFNFENTDLPQMQADLDRAKQNASQGGLSMMQ